MVNSIKQGMIMKYLSDYMNDSQTVLFEETGTFFAYNDGQFKEGIEANKAKWGHIKKYRPCGSGMYCPSINTDKLIKGLDSIYTKAIEQDMTDNGKAGIIHRELGNHEFCITHDFTDTFAKLSDYPITEAEIRGEAKPYLKAYYAWEAKQESIYA